MYTRNKLGKIWSNQNEYTTPIKHQHVAHVDEKKKMLASSSHEMPNTR